MQKRNRGRFPSAHTKNYEKSQAEYGKKKCTWCNHMHAL